MIKHFVNACKKSPLSGFVRQANETYIVQHYKYQLWKKKVYVDAKERVVMPLVAFYLSHKCNLRCEYCSNFNPFRCEIPSKEEIIESFEIWKNKIVPQTINLAGGEPLLNPDFVEIVSAAKKIWPNSILKVITNGLLLHQLSDSSLEQISDPNLLFSISLHLGNQNYLNQIERETGRLRKYGIKVEHVDSFNNWYSCLTTNDDGVPVPAFGNPKKAWSNCGAKYCVDIFGRELSVCGILSSVILGHREKKIHPSWAKVLDGHKIVSVDSTPSEIVRHITQGVMKACRGCPEKPKKLDARQLSATTVHKIQDLVSADYEKISE